MIDAKQIPDEAVEAAARAICAGNKWGEPCAEPCTDCVPEARASIAAALEAWPNVFVNGSSESIFVCCHSLVLPLPQEARDD